MTHHDGGASIPSLEELRAHHAMRSGNGSGPPPGFVGPVRERRKAREWGLVLASQRIEHALVFTLDGWVLRVAGDDLDAAERAIDDYEEENRDWPPKVERDRPRHRPSFALPVAFAVLAVFFAAFTGPVRGGSVWFTEGRADAQLLFSEPWRMVTALTLHADSQHIIGNAISGSIFGAALSRRLGPGGALLTIVASGALGNAANALYYLHDGVGHRSIGASTAVFAAIGLLAAVQLVLLLGRRGERRGPKRTWVQIFGPVVGGLALLGSLGSSPDSDLGAHGFGLLTGFALGLPVALLLRHRGDESPPSLAVQLASGAAAVAIVIGSWTMALL